MNQFELRKAPGPDDPNMQLYQAALILLVAQQGGSFTFTKELFNNFQKHAKKKGLALYQDPILHTITVQLVDEGELNALIERNQA